MLEKVPTLYVACWVCMCRDMLLRAQGPARCCTHTRYDDTRLRRLIKKTFPASVPAIYLDALKAAYARIEPTGADCEPALAPALLAWLASAWVLLPLTSGLPLLLAAWLCGCLLPACP